VGCSGSGLEVGHGGGLEAAAATDWWGWRFCFTFPAIICQVSDARQPLCRWYYICSFFAIVEQNQNFTITRQSELVFLLSRNILIRLGIKIHCYFDKKKM
jgi:hypothetical protein